MNISARFLLVTCIALFFASCSILGGGDDTPTFNFTANVSPSDGGSVDPSSGSFKEGETVSVQATPNTGFQFDDWSGDKTSSSNPLSFTITSDTEVTANFSPLQSSYEVVMTVADGANSMTLKFGQNNLSTSGFDSGNDKESPPPPPDGALHSYFKGSNNDLLYDFRSDTSLSETWNMEFTLGTGTDLELSWNITANTSPLPGTLTLRNGDSSIDVDMNDQSSVTVPSSGGSGSLIIEYSVQ